MKMFSAAPPTLVGVTKIVVLAPGGRMYYGTAERMEVRMHTDHFTALGPSLAGMTDGDTDVLSYHLSLDSNDLKNANSLGELLSFITEGLLAPDPQEEPAPTKAKGPGPDEWEQVEI